ncbi:hypothetical protein J7L05_08095 [bacterium]|nr:hypothetical protein [bacterium]
MSLFEPYIDVREYILPGYISLMDSYFDLLRKQELNPSKGLVFTQVLEDEWEDKLIVALVDGLHRNRSAYIILDFDDYIVERVEHQEDFNRFFQNIWELGEPDFEFEKKEYLERIERVMRRHAESDSERCTQLIVKNLPPIAEMDMETLEKFKELLFRRMENNLPLFLMFREDYSQLMRDSARLPDIIWALDECTYPAERYLFHPYGLRYIALMNRRRIHPYF